MSTKRVIVEISPSRVEVAVLRGTTPGEWRCERFGRAEWPSPYTTALPETSAALSKILTELGVSDATATLIYGAPGSVTAVTQCAASVGMAAAEQAALLALGNVADFPLEDAPSDTCVLMADKVVKGTKDNPGPPAQRHILAAADAEQRAAAVSAAVQTAGVKIDRIIPAEAVSIADAVRQATGAENADEVRAVLWVGEHSTNLAVGMGGRLLFVRTISAGLEGLAEVLCRPLRPRDPAPDAQPVTLNHEAARTLLLTAGVPTADALIPNYPTLGGSSLLPHLQPVLQRLSIEIKQSLRFGVPEADRPNVKIRLAGPGAAVPGLGDAIGRVSGFAFVPAENLSDVPDALDSSTGGLIAALARCPSLTLALMPTQTREAFQLKRGRKALLIGAALAIAYVAMETVDVHWKLHSARTRVATMAAAAQNAQGPLAVRQQAMTARLTLTEVERRIRKSMDQTADWSALMGVIAEKTPDAIRVQGVEMIRENARSKISLRALVRYGETRDPAALIHSYVNALESVPLIDGVRLGSTQRAAVGGSDSLTFDLTIGVVPLPPECASSKTPVLAVQPTEGK